jgi:hypothetical protein
MHNQHADLSQTLADQHRTQLRQRATHQRPLPVARQPRHRRSWSPRSGSPSTGLALRGYGLLDRRAFGIGSPASTFSPQIRLHLAVRARRVEGPRLHRKER